MLRTVVAVAAVLSMGCTTIIYVEPSQVEGTTSEEVETTGDPENTTHPRTVEDEGGIVITTDDTGDDSTSTGEIETTGDDSTSTGETDSTSTGDDLAGPDEPCETDEDCAVGRCLGDDPAHPYPWLEGRRCRVACDLDAPADACALAGSVGLCGVYEGEGRCLGYMPGVTTYLDLVGAGSLSVAIATGELHAIRVATPQHLYWLAASGAEVALFGPWGNYLSDLSEPVMVAGATYWVVVEGNGSYEIGLSPHQQGLGKECASDDECASNTCDGVCVPPPPSLDTYPDCGPMPPPTAAQVWSQVVGPRCGGCHGGGSGGLTMTDATTMRDALVGVPATTADMLRVTPGDLAGSYLAYKLSGEHAEVPGGAGSQMPLADDPLSDVELCLISNWIGWGAL